MNLPAEILTEITKYLSRRFSASCTILGSEPVSGGCIHQALRLNTSLGPFFLKWNGTEQAGNFLAEQRGLELLARHSNDLIARPLVAGNTFRFSYLLLEFVEPGKTHPRFWQDFGEKLARLHQNTAPLFGLNHDNYIGRLPQSNRQHPDFVTFFIEERLQPQVRLARQTGLLDEGTTRYFERLYLRLPDLFPQEPPALLHGDLWQGNFLRGRDGRARLIDPAVYYGHREAEMAFTSLFGGFAAAFYDAYRECFPLAPGSAERTGLFNLYPLLVHLNLFGRSYLNGITDVLDSFR